MSSFRSPLPNNVCACSIEGRARCLHWKTCRNSPWSRALQRGKEQSRLLQWNSTPPLKNPIYLVPRGGPPPPPSTDGWGMASLVCLGPIPPRRSVAFAGPSESVGAPKESTSAQGVRRAQVCLLPVFVQGLRGRGGGAGAQNEAEDVVVVGAGGRKAGSQSRGQGTAKGQQCGGQRGVGHCPARPSLPLRLGCRTGRSIPNPMKSPISPFSPIFPHFSHFSHFSVAQKRLGDSGVGDFQGLHPPPPPPTTTETIR